VLTVVLFLPPARIVVTPPRVAAVVETLRLVAYLHCHVVGLQLAAAGYLAL